MNLLHTPSGTVRVNSAALTQRLMTIPTHRRGAFVARLARRVRRIGGTI